MSESEAERIAYGCLFCHAGSEQRAADVALSQYHAVEATAPVKLRYHRG